MLEAVVVAVGDPNETIAQWTVVAGMSAAITSAIAIVTLLFAGRDSRERTRPVVLVEYRILPHASKSLQLVVRNAGVSIARDLKVSFDPPLERREEDDLIRTSIIDRYAAGIPALGPGQELTNIVSFYGLPEDSGDLPKIVTAIVEYRNGRTRWYTDRFILAVEVYMHHTYETNSASLDGQVAAMQKSVKEIARSLKAIQRSVRSEGEVAEAQARAQSARAQHERVLRAFGLSGEVGSGDPADVEGGTGL